MKGKLVFTAILAMGLCLVTHGGVNASSSPDSLLSGFYALQTTGTVLITPVSATGFKPSPKEPPPILVTGALSGLLFFDGAGHITTSSQVALDISGTTCPASAYTISGTYTVTPPGSSSTTAFAATGTLIITPNPKTAGPFCGATTLTGLNFALTGTGTIPQATIAIGTFGSGTGSTVGSSYLPTSVPPSGTAVTPNPVWDFATHGEGAYQGGAL